jgi:hypothetical protein
LNKITNILTVLAIIGIGALVYGKYRSEIPKNKPKLKKE